MMGLIDWFACNRVAANLLMGLIVLGGLLCLPSLRQESFPNVPLDAVSIAVEYPGAAPDEVEDGVCVPIEEAIKGLEGVQRLRSRSQEGFGNVTAELARGADRRKLVEEIKTRLAGLDSLPEQSRTPVVRELIDNNVLLAVVVSGDVDEWILRRVGERVRDEINELPEISRAELAGARPYEVAVELSELELLRHGLRFDDAVRAVRASSLDLPGGTLDTPSAEVSLRARGRAQRSVEFERLVLLTRPDGTRLTLGDVARVVDGFGRSNDRVRFDGERAVVIQVLERESRQVLAVSRAVDDWIGRARQRMPEGIELAVWNDEALGLESRRSLLLRNAAEGLVLVVLLLAFFLPLRLALWISAGIPVAFLGAAMVMSLCDVSINMMSLFAFIVALGLVVDDAIVVGERVAHHQESGAATPLDSAIRGAREVALPVVMAVLTTTLFLAPALTAPTFIGKLARPVPLVVIGCLLFSLVESLLILPAHLSHGSAGATRAVGAAGRMPDGMRAVGAGAMEWLKIRLFAPALELALRWPALIVCLSCVGLALSVGAVAGGWLRFGFLPEVETDLVTAEIVLPAGVPADVTEAHVRHLEAEALALAMELEREGQGSLLRHVLTSVGNAPDEYDDWQRGDAPGNIGRVRIQLVPGEERTISSLEVETLWRRRVGPIPEAESLRFVGSDIGSETPIDLLLAGHDREELARATQALKRALRRYPGVREMDDSLRGGKRELELRIRPEAEAHGLSLADLARQVRQGFHGEVAQRIQRGRDEVPVVVRYPADGRRSISDLERIRIRTPAGDALPFTAVASVVPRRGPASTQREAGRRTVNLRADVDAAVSNAREILMDLEREVLPALRAEHPGVSVRPAGQGRSEAEMLESLLRSWAFALVAAYALLAALLRSYVQPLLILLAVPFGFVGAVVGHLALGLQLSGFSLIGLVALTGVVINDALVLCDAIRLRCDAGSLLDEALREAALSRFRPIVLTSLTTCLGLLPLLFEGSAQAEWLKPMAVTLAVGVLFATPVTLLLVPSAHVLVARWGARVRGCLRLAGS